MDTLVSDLLYAARLLRRSWGFTLVAVLTLAIGLGANTTIFSLINGVLLRPLSFRDSQQLFVIHEIVPQWSKSSPILDANLPDFQIWRKESRSFDDIAILESTSMILAGVGETEQIHGTRASANLLELLGARLTLGRLFLPEEDQAGHGYVVVLMDSFWRTRFNADRSIVGRSITLDGNPYTVVGVLPESFRFPGAVNGLSKRTQFLTPLNGPKSYEQDLIGEFDFTAIGRLKPDVTPARAVAELNVIQARIVKEANAPLDLRAEIVPLHSEVVDWARRGLVLLFGATAALLLIICVNLANLFLARVPGRMREAGIRKAMGATELRLFRQMLAESMLLAVTGGLLGILLAHFGISWLAHLGPAGIPRLNEVRLDTRAVGFVVFLSLTTALLFGQLPAWLLSHTSLQEALGSAGKCISENRRARRFRGALVGAEVCICTVLLITAGLLGRSLLHLLHLDPGFSVEKVLAVDVDLPPVIYAKAEKREEFYRSVLDATRALPGVRAVAWTHILPLEGQGSVSGINLPGQQLPPEQAPIVNYRAVSFDYFETMGIPIIAGRVFNEHDRGKRQVIVSQNLARRLWPNQNAVGQECDAQWGPLGASEVIGVVGDIKTRLDRPALYMVYVADSWAITPPSAPGSASIVVKSAGDPSSIAGAVRNVIHRAGPDVPIVSLRSMSQLVALNLEDRRFQAWLTSSFAVSALLLASLGIFGVLAYSVEQRRREFGIRSALGAQPSHLLSMVMRQGLSPVALGLSAGILAALFTSKLLQSLVFGISPLDPLTFIFVSLIILIVAATACYIPARRAIAIDAALALRHE
jgi:putative ABC transport system permease protein